MRRLEYMVGKGENAGYQHCLLFPQCFQKASFPGLFDKELSKQSLTSSLVLMKPRTFVNKCTVSMVWWLVVLGFNATLTAKVMSWRSVMHMCFLAFSHRYQHNFSYQSHILLFSHASEEVRGENTPERKVASTWDQTHNHQVMTTCSPLSHPGRASMVWIKHLTYHSKMAFYEGVQMQSVCLEFSPGFRAVSVISHKLIHSSQLGWFCTYIKPYLY